MIPICWGFAEIYAIHNYKGFNSDHAIHAMMSRDFHFSEDLYYWNQNRLGSFIPMLGALLVSLGFSAVLASVAVQYILLAAILFFLYDLLKNKILGIALGLLLFFPHSSFINQVLIGHPYLAQNFFICLLIWMFFKRERLPKKLLYFLLPLIFGFAVWSSEISLASGIVFALVFFKDIKPALQRKNIIYPIFSFILSFGFIAYAKAFSNKTHNFDTQFIRFGDFWFGIKKMAYFIWETASFTTNKPPNSALFYSLLLFLILLLVFKKKFKFHKLSKFFLWSALASFFLVTLSNWWMVSNYPLRYFAFSYLHLMLALLFLIDSLKIHKWIFYPLIIAISASNAISGIYLVNNFTLKVPDRASKEEMLEISNMGDFGIIGSYWNSYAIDALSPKIEASPNSGYAVRYKRGVDLVFENDSIMIIRNGYLDSLKDSVQEFNRTLIKIGKNKKIGLLEYAFYQEIKK